MIQKILGKIRRKLHWIDTSDHVINLHNSEDSRLNIAICGLGNYAIYIANGISQTSNCRLSGIVTGTPQKAKKWRKLYQLELENCYNYENFDSIISNPTIDLIYISLPTALHKDFVIRAAKAKKHIIIEKPMAISSEDCKEMIHVCKLYNVQLAVGYRLHFEPHHTEIKRLSNEKTLGKVNKIEASIGYNVIESHKKKQNWRYNSPTSGGGPLLDLGIYCIQACRNILNEEPTNIEIKQHSIESTTWKMLFPSGAIAICQSSFNENKDSLKVFTEKGEFELQPAFGYGPYKGDSSIGEISFSPVNQQQLFLEEVANAILTKKEIPFRISGEEGKKDIEIVEEIYIKTSFSAQTKFSGKEPVQTSK